MFKKLEQTFRNYFPKRINNYKKIILALKGGSGLEIGGPSFTFSSKGFLPVYDHIANLDGCNFSSNTVWEGNIKEGLHYKYGNKTGFQIISDGSSLNTVPAEKYDFVLSCHSIEHIANPVKALLEWKRVIKKNGYILLIVPHKDNTFDCRRPVTSLEHLLADQKNNTQENDTTHFEEVNRLHDISKDPGIENKAALEARTADNFNNRCVHHHVFNTPMVAMLADELGLKICDIRHFNPFHIVMLLQKNEHQKPDNSFYLNPANEVYHKERFPSDKNW